MSDPVRLVSSRRVYAGRLLKIDLDEIELPSGSRAQLETIKHPGAAAALPFLDDGQVMLIRQYRHAAGGFILEVPAGKLDAGEPPEQCAIREVEEEIGYRPGRLEPLGSILTTPGFTDETIWLYEAHDLVATRQALEPHELLDLMPVPFTKAMAMVRSGEITDAKSVATILLAASRRS